MSHVIVCGSWAPSLLLFRAPLLGALVDRGHRVTAMAADANEKTTAALASMGVDFEEIHFERAGTNPLADAAFAAGLTRRLRARAADVFLGYTAKPVVYGCLAARLARIPRRFALITGLGYTFLGQESWRRRTLRRAMTGLYRASLAGCDRVFLQNPDDESELQAAGALPSRVPTTQVRGSGVDIDHYAHKPFPPAPVSFIFVGRLLEEKGIHDYVAMARAVRARHPSAVFRIAGWVDPNPSSVGHAKLQAWIAEGAVEYLGDLADVREAVAAAHVLVLPSYREGTPRSVLEAMSIGRAIITTDVPGCRETIVDGVHGRLVPPRDPEALAAAANDLLADREQIVAMGEAARLRACDLYDARKVADLMIRAMDL